MRDLDMTILDASADSVTGNQLRAAASHFPTGVAIVSSVDNNNEPVGCTISSFLSVSLEPPIVAVSLGQTTSTVSHLIAAGKFGISVLSSSQGGIAAVFADREVDHYERFAGVRWRPGRSGVPLLDNGLSSLECVVHDVIPKGDHFLILGHVQALFASGWGSPLVHHQGTLGSLKR